VRGEKLMKSTLAVLFSFLLVLPVAAPGQSGGKSVSKTGTAAATFLEIPVGARAIGMGTAFVSLANDASALYWNPAGSALLEQNEVAATHTAWIADTRFDFAALVIPLGEFGTLGFSFTSLSMDDMKVRTVELPEGTGEYFNAGDIAAGISYSRRLSDRFTVGFTAKYIQQTIWHESASAFALDLGTYFRTDVLGGLVIGAVISNFGTSMKLDGRDMRQFGRVDPTKLGSNEQVPSNIEMDSWDLPLLFQLGISVNAVKSDEYRWTVAVDAVHPSDNYECVNLGTELAYHDFLFLRGGYHSLFLQEAEGGLSLGFGVASNMLFSTSTVIQLDYAYRDMGRLEGVHTVSLGVRF
jgi:hypothetical protein